MFSQDWRNIFFDLPGREMLITVAPEILENSGNRLPGEKLTFCLPDAYIGQNPHFLKLNPERLGLSPKPLQVNPEPLKDSPE